MPTGSRQSRWRTSAGWFVPTRLIGAGAVLWWGSCARQVYQSASVVRGDGEAIGTAITWPNITRVPCMPAS